MTMPTQTPTQTLLALPTIHINGTSKSQLLELHITALQALRSAREALQEACPNERDFYPQGGGAIMRAMEQHVTRLGLLDRITKELGEIAEHIADA